MDNVEHRISELERKYRDLETKARNDAFTADSEKQKMKRQITELEATVETLSRKLRELGR